MAELTAEHRHLRARKARLTQSYALDDPKVLDVDQRLTALRLEERIAREAPSLTAEQRMRLAAGLLAVS